MWPKPEPEVWTLGILARASRGVIRMMRADASVNGGVPHYSTFREFRTTSGYVVPAAHELIITRMFYAGGPGLAGFRIVDGTNDVGNLSVTPPADMREVDDPYALGDNGLVTKVEFQPYDVSWYAVIPAGRYPAVAVIEGGDKGVGVTLMCVEIPL